MKVNSTWVERVVLWVGLVAEQGAGKSPVIRVILAPLSAVQDVADAVFRDRIREWREASRKDRADMVKPTPPSSLIVSDMTVGALARVLDKGPAVLVVADELSPDPPSDLGC